ncbi:hypothetical protein M1N46_01540 [Dehalococcoidia bacterium]|nr:hypothetical protein [Dehalococcoidia bacterium]
MAITSGARICQAKLGIKIHHPLAAKAELVLRQKVKALFDRIVADQEWWRERTCIASAAAPGYVRG